MTQERVGNTARIAVRKLASGVKRVQSLVRSQRLGLSPSAIYGPEFYDEQIDPQQKGSAAAVAETLIELFAPADVFDVGCGNGLYAGQLADRSVRAFGCDGSIHAIRRVPQSVFAFQHDLKQPLAANRRFDLCTCFEVAEHIPSRFSANLVATCAAMSDLVVFSSAAPGQGGTDHINEQPDAFWHDQFARRGHRLDGAATQRLRERFEQREVVHWLTANTRVYRRGDG